MQFTPPVAPAQLQDPIARLSQPRKRGDLAYQAVTVAAVLLTLCTLWLF